jgi:iron complex outermembrane recepter protein
MRRLVSLVASALLPLTLLAFPLAAQSGSIRGIVADTTGASLSGVTVTVDGTALRATSGSKGAYELRNVPAGTHTLRVRNIGYAAVTARVTVRAGESVVQDFNLVRSAVQLAPIDVVVGSRARHTAAEELAVPVDVYGSEVMQRQGTTETSQILQALSPSVNFPRQSVTDANDIVRPFTLRGLSPDHTLVLVNGWRRHQTALVNTFAYGMGAGSSGVDLNALPASAIDRIEVLRDGAAAQYGSDAIAGVVNLVLREGAFTPFVNADVGRYSTGDFPDDGTAVDVNGGIGIGMGRGSLGLFAEYRHRDPTNRAFADPFENGGIAGDEDVIDENGNVITKNNSVLQPNHHWGDGLSKDIMTLANFRMPLNDAGTGEVYAFGGYGFRQGTGQGYRRYVDDARNWPEIYPLGFLPTFDPDVKDYSAAGGFRGVTRGWSVDLGASFGRNTFQYDLTNTLNASLGACLEVACAPGLDGIFGNADDPGIPNQTSFDAGGVKRDEFILGANAAKALRLGLPAPVNLAFGAAFRREHYAIAAGELASYVDGGSPDQFGDDAPGGSQVFPGFSPTDATDQHRTNLGVYADVETNLTAKLLVNAATRFETYSDFGERLTGKLALRLQPSRRVTLRAAVGTGFRAPGLSQSHFSKVTTNFIFDTDLGRPVAEEVGNFPVDNPAAQLLGAQPLKDETSVNLSGGIAVSPRDNLTFTADYFYIQIDDRILLGATFDDDTTRAILARGGFTGVGGVQYFTNGLDTRTQGVDLTASLRLPAGTGATLDFVGSVNYTKNEIIRVDPLPAVLANSEEQGILDVVTQVGIEEERPDWRGTLAAFYSAGRFTSLVRGSYFGGFASAQPGFCDECRETYGGKALFDLEVGYRFLSQVGLSLGVRNLFDVYPDRASEINSFGIFPWAAASPFGYNGRYVYARTEVLLGR